MNLCSCLWYNDVGDAMKIIKCKKISGDKYKVDLDNGQQLTIYEDVIVNRELLGKDLDASLLMQIQQDNQFADFYNKAIRYIGIRLRSEKEMRDYLNKKGLFEKDIQVILMRLKEVGLLDDRMFAKAYIHDKLSLTNQGFLKIKNTLLQHEIDEGVIDSLLQEVEIDYDERIRKIIAKQLKHNVGTSKMVLRNKLYHQLISLGYEPGDILRNLDLNHIDEKGRLEKEYQKLYRKYASKYEGEAFYSFLKRKLYQKGFAYAAVDQFLLEKKTYKNDIS